MTEHQIQQEILLTVGRRADCRVWRQNTGKGRSYDGKRTISFGVVGGADISGIMSDGRRLEIEVKKVGGRQSAEQKSFQAMVEKYNGVYILARSVEEAIAGIDEALSVKGKEPEIRVILKGVGV